MFLEKIDRLILGYRRIKARTEDLAEITSRLLRAGIKLSTDNHCEILVKDRDEKRVKNIISEFDIELGETEGLYGHYKKIRHKTAILIGLLISLILFIISENTVWDVRIDGNSSLPDAYYVDLLRTSGLSVGDSWFFLDRSIVETNALNSSDEVAWLNINRRGAVAYVTVVESQSADDKVLSPKPKYSNLVATEDCVIEEITVTRGRAMVKPGDVVSRGDVLILGIAPDEAGAYLLCAEGEVVGRINRRISVEVGRESNLSEPDTRRLISLNIKLFKFCGNIFKSYGNLDAECDIIEEVTAFSLPGGKRLPVSFIATYAQNKRQILTYRTDEQLLSLAMNILRTDTALALRSADLISIRTSGEFTDLGYRAYNDLVFTTDVGISMPIEVGD